MSDQPHKIWMLLGRKAGDNTQVRALAEATLATLDAVPGGAIEEKHILARPWELLANLALGATLAGIDRSRSSELGAPWPDVVISAGRRNEPVARWIREQSGGHTKLVHLGRPWAPLDTWDLIITTPQYFLPEQSNIVHNSLPLHRPAAAPLAPSTDEWQALCAQLPRPQIAVLVGGNSGQFVFTADKGARLGALANALAVAAGGSLLVTDSPRTPLAAGDAVQNALTVPSFVYRFGAGGVNPYQHLLSSADAFVVTGESMSMLAEAVDTGRPVNVFDMGDGDAPWWSVRHNWRYKPLSHRIGMALGPTRMRRDIGRIQTAVVRDGRAGWLSENQIEHAAKTIVEAMNTQRGDSVGEPGNDETAAWTEKGSAAVELARSAAAVRRLLPVR